MADILNAFTDDDLLAEEEDDLLQEDEEKHYEHFRLTIDRGQAPLRIDKFLSLRMEKASRSRIQNAARANAILVNGKPVKPNYKVKPADEIVLVLPKPVQRYMLKPEPVPLDLVYEDDDLMVINKPAGLVVHPGCGNYTGTLVHGLLYHFEQLPQSQNPHGLENEENALRPGLVHRIDKNTSGLMVIAKTDFALTHLARQFFDHTVIRRYIALVWGDLPDDTGTITGHIGRDRRFRQIMSVYPDGEAGKHAVTHYRVLERLGYVTLVECRLETGRTHQIRVHFSHIGHPLFNDPEYGGNRIVKGTVYTKYRQFIDNCFALLPRQALHAQILGFTHPETAKPLLFEAPLPNDMQQVLDKWRRYMNAVPLPEDE
ncbi:RluA family pseudouridine synthase [Sphingobacteriales bacterium UPWRP_1]|nr:RNA pseudouridine synthase [Sphingobacteriales bacterium TSM_CSM]PSJ75127.1 RluA family pseudouridine synthase [Sphingobacteriales bacterium UPWRP_1]